MGGSCPRCSQPLHLGQPVVGLHSSGGPPGSCMMSRQVPNPLVATLACHRPCCPANPLTLSVASPMLQLPKQKRPGLCAPRSGEPPATPPLTRRHCVALPSLLSFVDITSPLCTCRCRLQRVIELPPYARGCHVITQQLMKQVQPLRGRPGTRPGRCRRQAGVKVKVGGRGLSPPLFYVRH